MRCIVIGDHHTEVFRRTGTVNEPDLPVFVGNDNANVSRGGTSGSSTTKHHAISFPAGFERYGSSKGGIIA